MTDLPHFANIRSGLDAEYHRKRRNRCAFYIAIAIATVASVIWHHQTALACPECQEVLAIMGEFE